LHYTGYFNTFPAFDMQTGYAILDNTALGVVNQSINIAGSVGNMVVDFVIATGTLYEPYSGIVDNAAITTPVPYDDAVASVLGATGAGAARAGQHLAARHANMSRSSAAIEAGIKIELHHPDPLGLGGKFQQGLEALTPGLHAEFHSRLNDSLKTAGLPTLGGSPRGSKASWFDAFEADESLRGQVDQIVRDVSQGFDQDFGTALEQGFETSVAQRGR
jgi:hypothetical protein